VCEFIEQLRKGIHPAALRDAQIQEEAEFGSGEIRALLIAQSQAMAPCSSIPAQGSTGSHGSTELNRTRHQDMTAASSQSARPYIQHTPRSIRATPESPSSCLDEATLSKLWVFCVLGIFFFLIK